MATRYKHLQAFLASPAAAPECIPTIHGFRGFFFAVAAYPELIPPQAWLPQAFGVGVPAFRSQQEGAHVREDVIGLYNEAFALMEDRPGNLPRGVAFAEDALSDFESDSAVAQWSRGFLRGHFWIEQVVGERPMDEEFQSSAYVLGFFADRETAESFAAEGIQPDNFPAAVNAAREVFASALASYAALGRQRELEASLFEAPRSPEPPAPALWRERRGPNAGRKVGRNDPCPCGSGKKYKKCCANKPADAMQHAAYEVRRLQDRAEPLLLRFVQDELGDWYLEQARERFRCSFEGDLDVDEEQLFLPWMLYSWEPEDPEPEDAELDDAELDDAELDDGGLDDDFAPTAAELFLGANAPHLEHESRRFIDTVATTVNSFHEVLEVETGRRLRLRDLLLGSEHQVYDEQASLTLKVGKIIYGRAVAFDRVALLIGCGTISLPASFKQQALELREALVERRGGVEPFDIRDLDDDIREMYLFHRDRLLHPPLPKLTNTEGDPIEFHRIRCKVDSIDDAFAALASLNPMDTPAQMLEMAERDPGGSLRRIEFPWVKRQTRAERDAGLQPPVLGHLTLENRTLTAEVNSAGRWRRLKRMLRKRLGDSMRDLEVRIETVEEAMERRERAEDRPDPGVRRER